LKLAFAKPKRRRKKGGGAGKTRVPHRRRPALHSTTPVHITLRVRDDLPNLRGFLLAGAIGAHSRHAASSPWARQARRRDTFRVVHFSIQPNHLHLIVEAENRTALARGVQGLKAGMARRLKGPARSSRRGLRGPLPRAPAAQPTRGAELPGLRVEELREAPGRAPRAGHGAHARHRPLLLGAMVHRLGRRAASGTHDAAGRAGAHVVARYGLAHARRRRHLHSILT
jgi:REP element-mobilizing transposase RayT